MGAQLQKAIGTSFAAVFFLFSYSSALADMCEGQEAIPWRRAVAAGKLPLRSAFDLKPDGTVGGGSPNAVIDRLQYKILNGGIYMLFTDDRAEIYVGKNWQFYISRCEYPSLAAIAIGDKVATVERILSAKSYMNLTKLGPDAIKLILQSNGETMDFLTISGSRFAIGAKTVSALKSMYQEQKSKK